MIRMGFGVKAGALAFMAVACVAAPRMGHAQSWTPAAWSSAASGDVLADARGEDSFLRLSESRRQPAPVPATRGPIPRRLRPNTISLGIQGQYGAIRGSSRLADGFDHGPGYAL